MPRHAAPMREIEWRLLAISDYEVSDAGDVRSVRSGKLIANSTPSDSGYARIRLGKKLVRRHLLILEAFRGPRPTPKHHGAHLDGNKSNNALLNLDWKLPTENEADKKIHGTAPRGGHFPSPSARVVKNMIRRFMSGDSLSSIAKRYGIHRSSVSRYVRGLRRKDVRARAEEDRESGVHDRELRPYEAAQ